MIHIVIGTRAQVIKMAPIMKSLQDKGIDYNFVFMAQHHKTISDILKDFELKEPDYVMGDIGTDVVSPLTMVWWSLRVLTHGVIHKNKIFKGDKNGVALIHGDAPPLLLGGIIAKLQGLVVGQVESGLRSYNFFRPFPEELTRVIASRFWIIDLFFCQDKESVKIAKQYNRGKVYATHGNSMYDSTRIAWEYNKNKKSDLPMEKYAIATIHRFETISKPAEMEKVYALLKDVAKTIKIIFILHPPTETALKKYNLYNKMKNTKGIMLLPRQSFFMFNQYLSHCEFMISDGGGNQAESYYLGIPCIILRSETELREGIGKNVVISKFNTKKIMNFVKNYKKYRMKPLDIPSPTERIIKVIKKFA